MAEGYGFGKIILFGEHFVVYGLPAIASAIGDKTIATVETSKKFELVDKRPATDGYKVTKKDEMDRSMKLILDFMKINPVKTPVKITLSGNLFCTSGIGASAAMATSIARAFSEHFNLSLNDEQVNRISYEGEKGSAGTPSGIDNTCATFGGLLWFEKNLKGGENRMELIKAKKPIEIVLGNTGISQETKLVVEDVKKAREADPKRYERIFSDYMKLVKEARGVIERGDIKRLGALMDENHRLLKEMGLSCVQAEDIISVAKANGAAGAKITGTGRGGYVILLTPGKAVQDKVAKAIETKGYKTLKTEIGV
ncbi:MAG: mevalonate kinase [Candidatus Aenigmarchaeota archaeon]|nr:mevalonate kinase [Candidatus Aenigmarchaeota archaeon]